MKIPKFVDKLIEDRQNLAIKLNKADCDLSEWLQRNNIKCPSEVIDTGVMIYCEPCEAAEIVRRCIEDK